MSLSNFLSQGFDLSAISKSDDLRKRILFTIFSLFIYRIGTYIPLPGLNPDIINELANRHVAGGGILSMFNMFSGGALSRMTIFALNLMPYISSSIIMQLSTMIMPSMAALKKDGYAGRRKINQYTRYLTVLIASMQGYGISIFLMNTSHSPVMIGGLFPVLAVPSLVCGTLFLVWLGEQITSRGIGNGSSLIIFSGIVANMPAVFAHILEMGKAGVVSTFSIFIVMFVSVLVISFVVFMERAQRRVAIQYPQRQMTGSGGPQKQDNSHLPLKINSAGVIPPIFAYSLMAVPLTAVNFINLDDGGIMSSIVGVFARGGVIFSIILVSLIVFFAYFYTAIVYNPEETAENLRKSGGFIPGVRPGKATAEYIDAILERLTFVGALYMAFVCILPDLMNAKFGVPFLFGGTGLLIIVGVTMDTVSQVYTHIISHQYRGVLRKMKK